MLCPPQSQYVVWHYACLEASILPKICGIFSSPKVTAEAPFPRQDIEAPPSFLDRRNPARLKRTPAIS
ncbi:polyketide synthase [Histoplasma ohiense]|nr:polyketide synthase [Histoplasma ohiense (nom. inval.)]